MRVMLLKVARVAARDGRDWRDVLYEDSLRTIDERVTDLEAMTGRDFYDEFPHPETVRPRWR